MSASACDCGRGGVCYGCSRSAAFEAACVHPPVADTWTEQIWAAVGEQNAVGIRCIASVLRATAAALDILAEGA